MHFTVCYFLLEKLLKLPLIDVFKDSATTLPSLLTLTLDLKSPCDLCNDPYRCKNSGLSVRWFESQLWKRKDMTKCINSSWWQPAKSTSSSMKTWQFNITVESFCYADLLSLSISYLKVLKGHNFRRSRCKNIFSAGKFLHFTADSDALFMCYILNSYRPTLI